MTDNTHNVKVGDLVVRVGWFETYFLLRVTDRTPQTLETEHLNGSKSDRQGRLNNFRFMDNPAKMERLKQISEQLTELRAEMRNIYKSFPAVS